MTRNLFAYGTLLVPEIFELVVGKSFPSEPATLPGYSIRRVRGGDFPGIFETDDEDAVVPGRVFFDLNEESFERLDSYEDAFYELTSFTDATLSGSGEVISCAGYVVSKTVARQILTDKPWSLEWFEREVQSEYIDRLRRAGLRR